MKSNQKILIPFFAALFVAVLSLLTSCRKDPQEVIELLTQSEAAEIIEDAIANKTAGFTMPTIDAAKIIEAYLNSCDTPGDTTINKSKATGIATYNYTFSTDWLIDCSELNVPQSAKVDIEGNGSFNSAHWAGSDATIGNLTFTGLAPAESAYVVNGSYDLSGNLTGSLRKVTPSFDCVVALDLSNLNLDKSTYKITGGTGTAIVTAKAANGESKTINANLTFNGNSSVTVNINGYEHTFQWQ